MSNSAGRWNVTHGFDSRESSPPATHTHMATVSTPVGRWRKCLGKGRRRAYRTSRVVMDIAAFKVRHSVGMDIDTTALRAARSRSSSIGAMERYTWVRFAGKLTSCHTQIWRRSAFQRGPAGSCITYLSSAGSAITTVLEAPSKPTGAVEAPMCAPV